MVSVPGQKETLSHHCISFCWLTWTPGSFTQFKAYNSTGTWYRLLDGSSRLPGNSKAHRCVLLITSQLDCGTGERPWPVQTWKQTSHQLSTRETQWEPGELPRRGQSETPWEVWATLLSWVHMPFCFSRPGSQPVGGNPHIRYLHWDS